MSVRREKIESLIHRALSVLLQQHFSHILLNEFLTVSAVSLNKSLSSAKVYISTFHAKRPEETFKLLKSHEKLLRKYLAQHVHHQLRYIPTLTLIMDTRESDADRLDKFFNTLSPPKT